MTKRRILGGVMTAAAIAACSSSGPGQGSGSFIVKDQVATRISVAGDTLNVNLVSIAGVCALYQSGMQSPSRDFDIVAMQVSVNAPATLVPGTYPITTKMGMTAAGNAFYTGNRDCNTRYGGSGTGSMTITAIDASHVAGSYDLTFATGWPYGADGKSGNIKGSFDAPICTVSGLAAITCK